MKLWIATFGGGHTHPLTGESLRDCFTRVPGEDYRAAHNTMSMSVFGRAWAFLYEYEDAPGEKVRKADYGRAAGVKRFGLREIPFIPPSEVARTLWAAADHDAAIAARVSWWVDRAVQPAELAHQRILAARDVAAAVLTPDAPELPAEVA